MRVLVVCTANQDRSPTAEDLLRHRPGMEVRSAGTSAAAESRVTPDLVQWADKIFVMEERHREYIREYYPQALPKVVVLDVPDRYARGHPALVSILAQKLEPYLP